VYRTHPPCITDAIGYTVGGTHRLLHRGYDARSLGFLRGTGVCGYGVHAMCSAYYAACRSWDRGAIGDEGAIVSSVTAITKKYSALITSSRTMRKVRPNTGFQEVFGCNGPRRAHTYPHGIPLP
jgi:hypothetical protein